MCCFSILLDALQYVDVLPDRGFLRDGVEFDRAIFRARQGIAGDGFPFGRDKAFVPVGYRLPDIRNKQRLAQTVHHIAEQPGIADDQRLFKLTGKQGNKSVGIDSRLKNTEVVEQVGQSR